MPRLRKQSHKQQNDIACATIKRLTDNRALVVGELVAKQKPARLSPLQLASMPESGGGGVWGCVISFSTQLQVESEAALSCAVDTNCHVTATSLKVHVPTGSSSTAHSSMQDMPPLQQFPMLPRQKQTKWGGGGGRGDVPLVSALSYKWTQKQLSHLLLVQAATLSTIQVPTSNSSLAHSCMHCMPPMQQLPALPRHKHTVYAVSHHDNSLKNSPWSITLPTAAVLKSPRWQAQ